MNPSVTTVPFNDLARSVAALWDAAAPRWQEALERGWVVLGSGVRGFESEFAAHLGAVECTGVASGTDALELALRALGVRRGSHVALAANAGFYASTALVAIGAEPLYLDVAEAALSPGVHEVEAALVRGVDAVVITHLYGLAVAEIAEIAALCERYGRPLLEDCSQSHGARRGGALTGTFGDAAAFSFYPTKNLGALGDAGAVVTRRPDVAAARPLAAPVRVGPQVRGRRRGRPELAPRRGAGDRAQRRPRAAGCAQRPAPRDRSGVPLGGPVRPVHDDRCRRRGVGRPPLRPARGRPGVGARPPGRSRHQHRRPLPDPGPPAAGVARDAHGALPRTEELAGSVLSVPCFPEMTAAEVDHVAAALAEVVG